MLSQTAWEASLLFLIFFGFSLFWSLVCLLFSRWDGWHELRKNYPPLPAQAWKTKHRLRYLAMRRQTNLELCVTLYVNRYGMLVTMTPLFRVGHPPFFVPWSEIEADPPAPTRRGFLSYNQTVLHFKRAPLSPMMVKTEEWEALKKRVGVR